MGKMKLFLVYGACVTGKQIVNVEDFTKKQDLVLTGAFGSYVECPFGYVMDGTCTSGNDKDCRYNGTKFSHIIWCGENMNIALDFASYCYWKTGDFTEFVQCNGNELAMGLCSSSSRGDCSREAMAIKCCSLKTYRVSESTCNWLFPQSYGAESFCPSGKYAAGTCGVGRWNTDYCGQYGKSGMKCCEAIE